MSQPKLRLVWSAVNLLAQQRQRKKQRNNRNCCPLEPVNSRIAACIAVISVIVGGGFILAKNGPAEQNFSNLSKRLDDAEVLNEYEKQRLRRDLRSAIVPVAC
jgi:hypothetical protein